MTVDGERIPTRGSWSVEGSRVLFTADNGSLVSIRVAEIDLEASREASDPNAAEDEPARPLPKPADPPPPRLVLTDQDIPPMDLARRADEGEGGEAPATGEGDPAGGESTAAGASADGLSVVEWRDVGDGDTPLQVYGTVRNDGPRTRDGVRVVVVVYDEADNVLGRQPAQLQSTSLRAEQSTGFRVSFPEIFEFDRVEIELGEG